MKEQSEESPLMDRAVLVYNKFSSKTSKALNNVDLKTIGGAPKFEHATVEQMLGHLSQMTLFDEVNK